MGLDIAEMMLAIEDEFNVSLYEGEAQRILTFGDLVDAITKRIADSPTTEEEVAKNRIEGISLAKKYIAETLGIEELILTEETKLEELFPRKFRREQWKRLRQKSDRIPALTDSGSCLGLILFSVFFSLLFVCGLLCPSPIDKVFLFAAIILIPLTLGISARNYSLREPMDIPFSCQTMSQLAEWLIPNQVRLDRNGNRLNRESIEDAVRSIVSEQLGLKPENIERSTEFAKFF